MTAAPQRAARLCRGRRWRRDDHRDGGGRRSGGGDRGGGDDRGGGGGRRERRQRRRHHSRRSPLPAGPRPHPSSTATSVVAPAAGGPPRPSAAYAAQRDGGWSTGVASAFPPPPRGRISSTRKVWRRSSRRCIADRLVLPSLEERNEPARRCNHPYLCAVGIDGDTRRDTATVSGGTASHTTRDRARHRDERGPCAACPPSCPEQTRPAGCAVPVRLTSVFCAGGYHGRTQHHAQEAPTATIGRYKDLDQPPPVGV